MLKKSVVLIMAVLVACMAGMASADVVDPDSSSCVATLSNVFTGAWMNGQPYDYVTMSPSNQGETFAATGITITVTLKNALGNPIVGVPAQSIILFNSALCICPGGNISDAGTDANGVATFTGTMAAGGCVQTLDCFADGIFIGTVPVNINSPDTGLASPCFTDAGDLASLAGHLGNVNPGGYNICFDYNESGPPTIDAGDLAFFAGDLGAACQ